MPTTYNGIGTHYYGKRNLEKEQGQCEFCQNYGELESYETGLYFVVLFIPLIPLGKKQILDQCTVCTQHRAMPLSEWMEFKENTIQSSTDQLAQKMDDPDVAIEHLQTLSAFRQWEEAKQLVPAIENTHGNNVDVLLYLGSWYDQYGDGGDGDRCYEAAFKLDPKHPGCQRAKAVTLMQQGNLEEAESMLEAFKPPSIHYDPLLFFMLGNSYQSNNRHPEALAIYDQLAVDNPELATSDELRAAVKISEKASGLKSAHVRQKWFFQQGWFITLVVVAAVVGFILWAAFLD